MNDDLWDPWPKDYRIGARWPVWLRLAIRILALLPLFPLYLGGRFADCAYEWLNRFLLRGI